MSLTVNADPQLNTYTQIIGGLRKPKQFQLVNVLSPKVQVSLTIYQLEQSMN